MDIQKLINSGYARISNRFGIVSRLDRDDWKKHMVESMYPPKYGYTQSGWDWVKNMGDKGAANHYRRVYSKDQLEVGRYNGLKFPVSEDGPAVFKEKL